jgi:hypothetical protein
MLGLPQVRNFKRHIAKQFQIVLIIVASSIATMACFDILPAVALRYLVIAIFTAQIAKEVINRDRFVFTSPLFLLASVSGIMFSVFPALVVYVLRKLSVDLSAVGQIRLDYIGQTAEVYTLAFSLYGFALHGLACLQVREPAAQQCFRATERTLNLLCAVSLLLTAATFASVYLGPASIRGALTTSYPPLQFFIIIFLIHQSLQNHRLDARIVVAATGILLYLLSTLHLKLLIFIIISIILLIIDKMSLKYIIKFTIPLFIFIFISIIGLQVAKSTSPAFENTQTSSWTTILNLIGHKVVWRQIDTGYCFQSVIEKHSEDTFIWRNQTFWARALIPRVLWPEKENMSLGSEYSKTYCDPTWNSQHSASITLLGQPIIMGGTIGLLLHGGFLFAGLCGLTFASRRYPGTGRIIIVALLPWWIDFDQDFALYIANLVKFFLLMCLFAIPVFLFGRSSVNPQTTK